MMRDPWRSLRRFSADDLTPFDRADDLKENFGGSCGDSTVARAEQEKCNPSLHSPP
jgi:hypothetical protein